LAEASPELAARVAGAAPAGPLRSFAGLPGFMRRPWGPGWALVGDAGYYRDPITAHGTSDGLRDAQLLADATAAILAGEQGEEEAMGEYHQNRNRLSKRLFAVTEDIASYQWDTRSIEPHLRSLSAAMVDEVDYLLASDPGPTALTAGYSRRPAPGSSAVPYRTGERIEGQR
jgi:2-polyprenyl-6-methoxyphenol hydroxylase-like FAD-dependent oxidoreductase